MALAQSQARPQQTYMAQQGMSRGGPSGLAEVLDVLLDKGLVIDVFVRVSLVGIELLTIDARIVIASVDTYLRFAEAVNRLDLQQANNSQNLGDLVSGKSKALSSRPSRSEEPESRGDEPEDEAEPEDEPENEPEPENDAKAEDDQDEPRAEAEDENEDAQEDKGVLTRIKERGQVF